MFNLSGKQNAPKFTFNKWTIGLLAGLLIALLFGQSLLSGPSASLATPTPFANAAEPLQTDSTETQAISGTQKSESFLPDYDPAFNPALTEQSPDDRPFWLVVVDMLVKLVIVIGLAYATLRGLQWLQKGKSAPNDAGMTIRVLETVGLAPGRSLHLIVVGEKTLLIGSTENQVGLITELENTAVPLPDSLAAAEISSPEEELSDQVTAQISETAFDQTLTRQIEKSEQVTQRQPDQTAHAEWQTILTSMQSGVKTIKDVVGGNK